MFVFKRAPRRSLSDLESFLREVGDQPVVWLEREVKSWGEFSYAELEDLILSGRAADLIDWQSRYAKVVNEKFNPLWLAAIARASYNSTRGKITIDDSDPRVKDFLRQRAAELIRDLSDESRRAIANVILHGQSEHLAPKEIARQIRPLIGLNQRQAQANVNYRQKIFRQLIDNGLSATVANQRANKAAIKYASKQHRQRAEMIVHTELARAYNQGAHEGVLAAQRAGLMNVCEMVWTTAGTNRVCGRCLSLKDTVVGRTNEVGVTLPPLHPRCRCTISYRELTNKPLTAPRPHGLAAGNQPIYTNRGGQLPYLIGEINPKDTEQIKQAIDWFESNAVNAPVENALIITVTGEIYHCTGKLNTLDPIVELGEKLRGAIVTHNHPVGSANEYSFSDDDWYLFIDYELVVLRGIDEKFIYELNRNPQYKEDVMPVEFTNQFNARHNWVAQLAADNGVGYRRQER